MQPTSLDILVCPLKPPDQAGMHAAAESILAASAVGA